MQPGCPGRPQTQEVAFLPSDVGGLASWGRSDPGHPQEGAESHSPAGTQERAELFSVSSHRPGWRAQSGTHTAQRGGLHLKQPGQDPEPPPAGNTLLAAGAQGPGQAGREGAGLGETPPLGGHCVLSGTMWD